MLETAPWAAEIGFLELDIEHVEEGVSQDRGGGGERLTLKTLTGPELKRVLAIQKLRYEVVFATSGSATVGAVGDSGWPHALDCNCVV